jgi:hypothetical protein
MASAAVRISGPNTHPAAVACTLEDEQRDLDPVCITIFLQSGVPIPS